MLYSKDPKITGDLRSNRVNCWLSNYNKFSRKSFYLKNERRYLIISFYNTVIFLNLISVSRKGRKIHIYLDF